MLAKVRRSSSRYRTARTTEAQRSLGGRGRRAPLGHALICRDRSILRTISIRISALPTAHADVPLFRLVVEPNERNGLRSPSRPMVDTTTTVPRSRVGEKIGRLDDEDAVRLNQAAMVFLGLAVSPRRGRTRE